MSIRINKKEETHPWKVLKSVSITHDRETVKSLTTFLIEHIYETLLLHY
jgi:hypothetical protein